MIFLNTQFLNDVTDSLHKMTHQESIKKSLKTTHRKKRFSIFLSPAGMSLTKLSLGGNNDVIYKLFLLRESLVSDILVGDGNIEKFFIVHFSQIKHCFYFFYKRSVYKNFLHVEFLTCT
jgi:hypothetical protein